VLFRVDEKICQSIDRWKLVVKEKISRAGAEAETTTREFLQQTVRWTSLWGIIHGKFHSNGERIDVFEEIKQPSLVLSGSNLPLDWNFVRHSVRTDL
jgi:hypothetical protein